MAKMRILTHISSLFLHHLSLQTFKGSPKVIWRKCLAKCSGELLGKLPPKPTEVLLLRPLSMFIQDMGLASAPLKGMTNSVIKVLSLSDIAGSMYTMYTYKDLRMNG